MFKIDDETTDELINRLEQTKIEGNLSERDFQRQVVKQMSSTYSARPWVMCLALFIYRVALFFLKHFLFKRLITGTQRNKQINEYLEKLEFASEFGRMANANGRAWFFEQMTLRNIDKIDATFLVWSGVIQINRRKIYFCRWDSIFGYFLISPLALIALVIVAFCICDSIPAATRAFHVTIYLLEIGFLFKFFKGMSFDVYKVASKYYKANSWFGEPSFR